VKYHGKLTGGCWIFFDGVEDEWVNLDRFDRIDRMEATQQRI
jgi:hypothetical protein